MDYRRRWQQTRLRKARKRLLWGLAVCLVALLALAPFWLRGRSGLAWSLAPQQPGLVHFGTDGEELVAVWSTGQVAILDADTGQPLAQSRLQSVFPLLSEPVVFQGRAVLGSDDGRVRELNLATGEVAWETVTGGAVRARPARVGDLVLVGSDDGYLYCLQEGTGQVRWRVHCGGKIGAEAAPCTPSRVAVGTVGGGIVGVGGGGALTSSQAETSGEARATVQWRVPTEAPVLCPTVAFAEGRLVALGTDEGLFYLLEAATGKVQSRTEFTGLLRCRPVALPDRVVATDCAGQVMAFGLEGSTLWSRRVRGPITAGLAASEEAVYLGTARGEILALRLSDGRQVWRRRLPAPAAGSLHLTADLVVVGLSDGRVCALRRPPRG
ncbi:MAG: PQQ-binding-like beta-propeller repeat protein [candidate division WS1 bacterium]|nr:PQQ-binding-like beta-propeller repeat protein [candidate division WS1 bacterium]